MFTWNTKKTSAPKSTLKSLDTATVTTLQDNEARNILGGRGALKARRSLAFRRRY